MTAGVLTVEEAAIAEKTGGSRRVMALRVTGVGLSALGVFLVMLVLYLFAFTPLTAARDQHRLLSQLTGNRIGTFSLVQRGVAAQGDPVAVLRIPALHLRDVVVEGTTASDLEAGPGLMAGAALPGAAGNAVVAGRRVTFGGPFGALADLRRGDSITVTDGLGSFRYTVQSVLTVAGGEQPLVTPTRTSRLTLVTSDSSFVPNGWLTVGAVLDGEPVTAPASASPRKRPTEAGLGGDPSAGLDVALWAVLLLAAVALGGYALWRWRRPWPTYVLTCPVVLACGLATAEAVARCLPATL